MLLCLDVGNTHIYTGIVDNHQILSTFRMNSDQEQTEDEYASKVIAIINNHGYDVKQITDVIISSVVPNIDIILKRAFNKYFNIQPIFICQGIKSGIFIKLEDPKQLGADLLVGAVTAYNKYPGNNIVVDLGTATKFVVINQKAEFLGGAIAPGIMSSFHNLISSTAKLSSTSISSNISVIGRNTSDSIQSGLIYGSASMIDGMIERIKSIIGDANVILTGGNAHLVENVLKNKFILEPNLILEGLIILFDKNKK